MTDIRVVKTRFRAVLIPCSSKGEQWLRLNIDSRAMHQRGGEIEVSINIEFARDMVRDLEEAGLNVHE